MKMYWRKCSFLNDTCSLHLGRRDTKSLCRVISLEITTATTLNRKSTRPETLTKQLLLLLYLDYYGIFTKIKVKGPNICSLNKWLNFNQKNIPSWFGLFFIWKYCEKNITKGSIKNPKNGNGKPNPTAETATYSNTFWSFSVFSVL